MIAVIAGATGLVGSHLIQKLLSSSKFTKVISVSRRSLEIPNPKLEQVLVQNFSLLPQQADRLKGDIYFCCLGTTIKEAGSQENFRKVDFEAILEFGKIAKLNEAKSFVLISAMGANSASSIFYNRVKGETESALKALGLHSLTIFRPGLLVGHRAKPRGGEKFANQTLALLSPILPNSIEKMLATKADHLAERMLEMALQQPQGFKIISSKEI